MAARQKRQLEYNRKWLRAKRISSKIENDTINQDNLVYADDNDHTTNQDNLEFVEDNNRTSDQENLFCTDERCTPKLPLQGGQNFDFVHEGNYSENEDEFHEMGSNVGDGIQVDFAEDSPVLNDNDRWDIIDRMGEMVVYSSDEEDEQSLPDEIAMWTSKHRVTQSATDDLLKLLRNYGHSELPKTARTLLKTDRNVVSEEMSGMDYVYLGFKTRFLKHLDTYPDEIRRNLDKVDISLNIDGLPLFNSTKMQMWPILCCINIEPVAIFPIALTCGWSKPTNLDFMQETVDEFADVLHNGIEYGDKVLQIVLRCIVCDSPARALVKGTKQCIGQYF